MKLIFTSFMPIPPRSTQYSVQEQPHPYFRLQTPKTEIDTALCLLDNACYFAKAYVLEVFHIASHTSILFFKNHLVSSRLHTSFYIIGFSLSIGNWHCFDVLAVDMYGNLFN